ncbi:MAG: hypothetical protein WC091_02145 [Sulfuricellaceae bacterium]
MTLSEDQQSDLDVQIEAANKRIAEFESEQEDLQAQMQYLQSQQNDFELDQQEGKEIILCEHGLDINLECLYCNPENFCEHGCDINYDCPVCLGEETVTYDVCPHGISLEFDCEECDPVEARLQAEAAVMIESHNSYYPWCEKCPHGKFLDDACDDCDKESDSEEEQ